MNTSQTAMLLAIILQTGCGANEQRNRRQVAEAAPTADSTPQEPPVTDEPDNDTSENEEPEKDKLDNDEPEAPLSTKGETLPEALAAPSPSETTVPGSAPAWQSAPLPPADVIASYTAVINRWRSEPHNCGNQQFPSVPALTWHDVMYKAAWRHSSDLDTNGISGHYGSDGSDPGARIRDSGYKFRSGGENVATGFYDLSVVFQAWMNSPAHCVNIMAPYFSEYSLSRIGGVWTLVFGNPR